MPADGFIVLSRHNLTYDWFLDITNLLCHDANNVLQWGVA